MKARATAPDRCRQPRGAAEVAGDPIDRVAARAKHRQREAAELRYLGLNPDATAEVFTRADGLLVASGLRHPARQPADHPGRTAVDPGARPAARGRDAGLGKRRGDEVRTGHARATPGSPSPPTPTTACCRRPPEAPPRRPQVWCREQNVDHRRDPTAIASSALVSVALPSRRAR